VVGHRSLLLQHLAVLRSGECFDAEAQKLRGSPSWAMERSNVVIYAVCEEMA
jgi:hypothetical protein